MIALLKSPWLQNIQTKYCFVLLLIVNIWLIIYILYNHVCIHDSLTPISTNKALVWYLLQNLFSRHLENISIRYHMRKERYVAASNFLLNYITVLSMGIKLDSLSFVYYNNQQMLIKYDNISFEINEYYWISKYVVSSANIMHSQLVIFVTL